MLRVGILGLSDGNGHPYSWSAIFNGYDHQAMASCPFPVIPDYLSRQTFPDDQLPGARVTHVWTQDSRISDHVAAAARIPHVVAHPEDMIGEVDAVLLARDDADRHLEMSLPFLEAGLPIYIDKPVALRMTDLERMFAAQQFDGQIFSCSALRFAPSLDVEQPGAPRVGAVRHIDAVVPKSWERYAVHLLDPILARTSRYGAACQVEAARLGGVHVATLTFDGLTAVLTCLGDLTGDIRITYHGTDGFGVRVFTDTFAAFRAALEQFVTGVRERRVMTPRMELEAVVRILEAGACDG